ncbi:MAG: hypothetical protein ACTSRU_04155 [Candidatus Hodarchaeales archaeon]
MSESNEPIEQFVNVLVSRGLGIYGRERMANICYESGVALLDDNTIDWLEEDRNEALQQLIVNYSSVNLPAKMTAIVLAKKFDIPLPEELKRKKKRKSRFRRMIERAMK